jgi:transcriptional regulator with XRE-family HTH domain
VPTPARGGTAKIRQVEADVGPRLRTTREEAGLTLRELARRLGISPSAISQIETGKSRPSVSTLYAIVSELGMSLDELFGSPSPERRRQAAAASALRLARPGEPTHREPASEQRRVQRAGTRRALDLETGVRWERLTPHSDPVVDFLYLIYPVGGSSSEGELQIRHSGSEYGIVLKGTLEVTVGFDVYELGPGDSISFDSSVPHCLRNIGNEPVHGIWFVIGRESDPRARSFESQTPEAPEQ